MMTTPSVIISTIFLYLYNIHPVASQYTEFVNTVCNTSIQNYSPCACHIANVTAIQDNITCFSSHNCPYDLSTNSFCSAHGRCDFISGTCLCDTDYGATDCSQKYETFLPSKVLLLLMIICGAILLILCLALNVWVHIYREINDVRAMSVLFTHFTLIGCALICCGTISMSFGYNDANCVILEWFHFLGICMVISCALLKSYRIASIFGDKNFLPSDLTDSVLLKYFSVIMIVNVIFLALYTAFNFIEGGAYVRYKDDTLFKETRCSSEPLTIFTYSLLVAWQLILLLFVIKYGNQTRKASDIFKETKCIYVGSNIGSMFFIAFGILILFTTNYTLQIVIRGYGSLVVVSMVIFLLFGPKFRAVYDLKLLERKQSMEQPYTDDEGNVIDKQEADLRRQYETHVKEPNGKELLLLLDALVKEVAYRARMNMLSIELGSVDLLKVNQLMEDIKKLLPEEFPNEANEPVVKKVITTSIDSGSAKMSTDEEKEKEKENKEHDNETEQITRADTEVP